MRYRQSHFVAQLLHESKEAFSRRLGFLVGLRVKYNYCRDSLDLQSSGGGCHAVDKIKPASERRVQ